MTMIERVARAICESMMVADWDTLIEDGNQEIALGAARAALEAMREPTEAMVSASHAALGYDGDYSITRWQAMINKTLEGE